MNFQVTPVFLPASLHVKVPLSHVEWQLTCHEFSLAIHLDCKTIVLEQHFYLLRAKGSTEKHAFVCEYLFGNTFTAFRLYSFLTGMCGAHPRPDQEVLWHPALSSKLSTQLSVAQPPLYLSTETF